MATALLDKLPTTFQMLSAKLHHYVGYSQQVLMATDHHCWHLLSGTMKTNHFKFSCFSCGRIYHHSECIMVTVWQLYPYHVPLAIFILSSKHWKYFIQKLSYGSCTFFPFDSKCGHTNLFFCALNTKVKSNLNFYQNEPYRKSVHDIHHRSLLSYTTFMWNTFQPGV
jgi:hypothetical protein